MGWGEYSERDARIDAALRAREAEEAERRARGEAHTTTQNILEDARSRCPGDDAGAARIITHKLAKGGLPPLTIEILERELEDLRLAASAKALRCLKAEAAEADAKEQSLISASASPALTAQELLAAIHAALTVNSVEPRTGYTEIYTSRSGVVYMTMPEPGQPVDPTNLSCPAQASSHAGTAWAKFQAALPLGGLKRQGLPTGKSLADVAAETAKRLGGEVNEEEPMEGLFLPVVTLPSGGKVKFPAGVRPASQRPWLRGGYVEVCQSEGDARPVALAELWKSAGR